MSKFISTSFSVRGEETNCGNETQGEYDSPLELLLPKGILLVSHNPTDYEICRTISNFGRCFCSSSIAGGELRNEKSCSEAIALRSALIKLSYCQYTAQENDGANPKVCDSCIRDLKNVSCRVDENILHGKIFLLIQSKT